MNVRLPIIAATLALPMLLGGCVPPGSVSLPSGVCDPGGAGVLYAIPNSEGKIDLSRYSTANCKK